jgi:hypothetical protein
LSFCDEKPALQSKFTLLKSKFFPAKIPFSKIQKKNLAGKVYFAKERGLFCGWEKISNYEEFPILIRVGHT